MTTEEAKKVLENLKEHTLNYQSGLALDMAISALSKNKEEDRLQGHWIEKGYVGDGNYLFECSECHSTDTQSKAIKVNYCWCCGADMKGCKE